MIPVPVSIIHPSGILPGAWTVLETDNLGILELRVVNGLYRTYIQTIITLLAWYRYRQCACTGE